MPDYRRYFVAGGTYFFTLVTAARIPLFRDETARSILLEAIKDELASRPVQQVAFVILPNHLHVIWALPAGDDKYPKRWQAIKARFTHEWLGAGGTESAVTEGYGKQRRRGVWQPRFMEHVIRDDIDFQNHADYLHWNPVKHKYAKCPKDWPWSSFHKFVDLGEYPADWGCSEREPPQFGSIDESLIE